MRLDDIVNNKYFTEFRDGKFYSRDNSTNSWFPWPDSEIGVLKSWPDADWNLESRWMEFSDLAKAMLILL